MAFTKGKIIFYIALQAIIVAGFLLLWYTMSDTGEEDDTKSTSDAVEEFTNANHNNDTTITKSSVMKLDGKSEGGTDMKFDQEVLDLGNVISKFKCVVINLEHNRVRMAQFHHGYTNGDLASKSIPLQRIEAVDAKKIAVDHFLSERANKQLQDTIRNGYRIRHSDLTPGAVGCFLSHITAMRMLIDDNTCDVYLVFEDDSLVPSDLYKTLLLELRVPPPQWDIITLGYHYAVFDNTYTSENFKKLKTFWGMYAYFVSKKGAQKIIELYETKKIDMQIDSQISLKMHKEPGSISVFSTRSRIVNSGPLVQIYKCC